MVKRVTSAIAAMNIGSAATASGLSAKTIRYYEDIGLVTPLRSANGYRNYSAGEIQRLQFLQRARALGFSIDECRQLLSLYEDKDRASANVKAIASDKIDAITRKIKELEALRESLKVLVDGCSGDQMPECPIIDSLAGSI